MALETGLVAGYKFEGNSNDAVGTNNGTDTAITYSTGNGKILQGAGFDGSTSKILLGATTFGGFTYSGWIKNTNHTAIHTIKSGKFGAAGGSTEVRVNTTGNLELVKSAVSLVATSTGTVTDATWTMVSITYDTSGNWVFYINGSASGSGLNLVTFANENAIIGCHETNIPTYSDFFLGAIDEFYIWNTIKTGTEITTLYNGGAGMTYNGTIFVSPSSTGAFNLL